VKLANEAPDALVAAVKPQLSSSSCQIAMALRPRESPISITSR